MDFEEKLKVAHMELEKAGLSSFNYNPPLVRMLRKMGLKLRPAHYSSILKNTLFITLSCGPTLGLLNWYFRWGQKIETLISDVSICLVGAFAWGVISAIHSQSVFKKKKLTSWNQLL